MLHRDIRSKLPRLDKSAFFGYSRKRYTYKCIRTLKRPITIIHVKLIHTPYNGIKTLKVYIICIYIIQDRGITCTYLVCLYVICVLNFLRVCYFRLNHVRLHVCITRPIIWPTSGPVCTEEQDLHIRVTFCDVVVLFTV